MSKHFYYIAPIPQVAADLLATYQVSCEFHSEVRYRQELEQYCQWYYATTKQHRQELQKMRQDFNLLGWFNRGQR